MNYEPDSLNGEARVLPVKDAVIMTEGRSRDETRQDETACRQQTPILLYSTYTLAQYDISCFATPLLHIYTNRPSLSVRVPMGRIHPTVHIPYDIPHGLAAKNQAPNVAELTYWAWPVSGSCTADPKGCTVISEALVNISIVHATSSSLLQVYWYFPVLTVQPQRSLPDEMSHLKCRMLLETYSIGTNKLNETAYHTSTTFSSGTSSSSVTESVSFNLPQETLDQPSETSTEHSMEGEGQETCSTGSAHSRPRTRAAPPIKQAVRKPFNNRSHAPTSFEMKPQCCRQVLCFPERSQRKLRRNCHAASCDHGTQFYSSEVYVITSPTWGITGT
ncbi:hypothetical protein SODALDRAFT_354739 [Sodiomyces alkalinus F11]|uniref:Uncharacterized protein n=1 Tax=Sodiomyces alkalinus (strain CBS 110278 / VKM F-3762 / F11) TaxID=1314773 RepID=A0A3N2Q7G7_SODAK|nr:hypothetical protein SODALDRAFT_354739 [Sodiomyces alkalinus F11]ROT42575.1 hypothetical protein SODALDRAFT_354739 [Sodiomyces alkalinus F11]